jgi:hypothetical protein
MFGSQISNAIVTAVAIVLLVLLLPNWNGVLGSFAQSAGLIAELIFLAWLYRRNQLSIETGQL